MFLHLLPVNGLLNNRETDHVRPPRLTRINNLLQHRRDTTTTWLLSLHLPALDRILPPLSMQVEPIPSSASYHASVDRLSRECFQSSLHSDAHCQSCSEVKARMGFTASVERMIAVENFIPQPFKGKCKKRAKKITAMSGFKASLAVRIPVALGIITSTSKYSQKRAR